MNTTITVSHGPFEGRFMRYGGCAVVASVGVLASTTGVLGVWRFLSASQGEFSVWRSLVWLLIGVAMLIVGYHSLRLRHAFTSAYTVTDTGIEVRAPGEETLLVRWQDFGSATVRRSLSLIELTAPTLCRPIALFHSAAPLRRYTLLREVVTERLGSRLRVTLC